MPFKEIQTFSLIPVSQKEKRTGYIAKRSIPNDEGTDVGTITEAQILDAQTARFSIKTIDPQRGCVHEQVQILWGEEANKRLSEFDTQKGLKGTKVRFVMADNRV